MPKQTRKDAVKEKLNASKEALEQNLRRGEETLCEYIHHVLTSHRANITPSDGLKNERK